MKNTLKIIALSIAAIGFVGAANVALADATSTPAFVPTVSGSNGDVVPTTSSGTNGAEGSSTIATNTGSNSSEGSSTIATNTGSNGSEGSSTIATNTGSNGSEGGSFIPTGSGSNGDDNASSTSTATTTNPTNNNNNGGGTTVTGGGGSSSISGGSALIASSATTSTSTAVALAIVPSSATTTLPCPLISTFMFSGASNSHDDVVRLQGFLKDVEHLDVGITGTFDDATVAAVKAFQAKYLSDIMGPWQATLPSGKVYITTKKKINEIACKSSSTLTPSELAIIDSYLQNQQNAQSAQNGSTTVEQNASTTAPIIGQTGTGESNTAAAANASIFDRLWNFIKGLF